MSIFTNVRFPPIAVIPGQQLFSASAVPTAHQLWGDVLATNRSDQAKQVARVHEETRAALEQVKQLIDRAERMIEEYREDAPGSRGPAGNKER